MRLGIPSALACLLGCLVTAAPGQAPDHGPRPTPCPTPTPPVDAAVDTAIDRLQLNRALSDEFNGDRLDNSKWHGTNPWWQGRPPGRFEAEQATVGQGHLALAAGRSAPRATDKPGYATGAVVSRHRTLYGYYEVRARAAPAAVTSAFWFYRDEPGLWTEIDVFENTGHPRHRHSSHTNAHVFRLPGIPWATVEAGQATPLAFDVSASWTVYGLHWTPTHLDFYINGCRVRRHRNTLWHQPLHAVLDIELMPDWLGLPDDASLPAHFRIDYFRAWQ